MQVDTQHYIDGIKHNIEEIKNKQVLPKWQIDFEKYGGRAEYERIKILYWERFDNRDSVDFELKNEALVPVDFKLMKQFRKDINVKLDIPNYGC